MPAVAISGGAGADPLGLEEARRLTERIRLTAMTVRDGIEKLQTLVERAKAGHVHEALGYPSWTAYLADTLGDQPLRLPRDQRQELVGYLAGEGMSTRAIGAVVGAAPQTVVNDLDRLSTSGQSRPATVTSLDGRERPATRPAPVVEVDVVTGEIDSAPPPERPQPRRRPLIDAFGDAVFDLGKVADRLDRLVTDERYPRNAEQVAAKYRNDLLRARDALDGVLVRLTNP